jgi:lipoprotein NlpI
LSNLTEKEVLEKARRGEDDKKIREQLCEAYYYLGEERLWKGNWKGAKEYFQKCIETSAYNFIEYQLAKITLENMKEK